MANLILVARILNSSCKLKKEFMSENTAEQTLKDFEQEGFECKYRISLKEYHQRTNRIIERMKNENEIRDMILN